MKILVKGRRKGILIGNSPSYIAKFGFPTLPWGSNPTPMTWSMMCTSKGQISLCHCCSTICYRLNIHRSRVSLGRPLVLELDPTTNPLLASHASGIHPTTSSVPGWTMRLQIGLEPSTPMLTTHCRANEKR